MTDLNEILIGDLYGIEGIHPAHRNQLDVRVEFIDYSADGIPVLHKGLALGLERGQVRGDGGGEIGSFRAK